MIFTRGFLFGLTLQLAVGPVFFAVLHKSIKKGFNEAFKMVLGVTLVDAIYISVSFTGIGTLLRINFLNRLIYWCGAILLIIFGLLYFRRREKKTETAQTNGNSLIYGIKLTLTNPLTIVFWSGTFGALIASGKLFGVYNILGFSLGCVFSTLVFLSIISLAGKYIARLLNTKIMRILDYGVGIFLVIFGISLFFK